MSISLMTFWFFLEIVSNSCLISHMENLITVVETAWDAVEKENFLWRMSCYWHCTSYGITFWSLIWLLVLVSVRQPFLEYSKHGSFACHTHLETLAFGRAKPINAAKRPGHRLQGTISNHSSYNQCYRVWLSYSETFQPNSAKCNLFVL